MRLIRATLERPPARVTTKHGERIVVNVAFNGRSEKLWQPPDRDWLMLYREGQYITVTEDSKGKLHAVEPCDESNPERSIAASEAQPPNAIPRPPTHPIWSPDQKREVVSRIEQYTQTYRYCYQKVMSEICPTGLPTDQVREVATTVFIAATRGI